jgi:hypothetical protein
MGPRLSLCAMLVALGCVTIPDTKTLVGELGGSGGGASSGSSGVGNEAGDGGEPTGSGGTAGTGGSAGGGGMIGGGSGGTDVPACTPEGPELSLPRAVDEWFFSSGYAADPSSEVVGIAQEECPTPPNPPGAYGSCHRFEFNPIQFNDSAEATAWVYWQAPANNWGDAPGIDIAPGATAVKFRAWGGSGNEDLYFFVGGATGVCADAFRGEETAISVELNSFVTEYEIVLPPVDYSGGVVNGFGWHMTINAQNSPGVFYVDNIRWE